MTASEFQNAMIKAVKEFVRENQTNIDCSREWLNEFECHLKEFDDLENYLDR